MPNFQRPPVYYGTVKRGDLFDIFGKGLPEKARIHFAWGQKGWGKDGHYQDVVLAYWSDGYFFCAGTAQREWKNHGHTVTYGEWKHLFFPKFPLDREMIRVQEMALAFGWQEKIREGLSYALAKMMEQQLAWDAMTSDVKVAWENPPHIDEPADETSEQADEHSPEGGMLLPISRN